jgi:amino acid transporter
MTELLRNQGLKRVRMRLFTAVIVVFTLTCSGSFGMEDVVSSSGPGLTLLMIVVLPFLWSVPMAFIASEMGSMIPEAGGSYRWVRRAMGEYWSFQSGWWWSLSVFIDSAVYVALALGYIQSQLNLTSLERWLVGVAIVAVFTFINIRGLELTGWSLTVIQVVVMVPFLLFTILAFMRGTGSVFSPFQPAGQNVVESMNLGLAIMMWMYAGWESMSTLAGEIENPQKVIPRALMIATPIVIITYFVTVAALIRAGHPGSWANMMSDTSGSPNGVDYIVAAKIVGGAFLGWLMFASAIASNIGLYAGYLASGARPPFQISRDRLLFRFFGTTSKRWGTPWVAILIMGLVNCVLISREFTALIVMDIFLLMFAYILVFISAIVLRIKEPDTPRPFRVPLPTWALAIWVAIPIAIAVFALFTNGSDYLVGGLIGVLSGPIAYLVFKYFYHGTTDRALEGATITPEGELTQFGAEIEGVTA